MQEYFNFDYGQNNTQVIKFYYEQMCKLGGNITRVQLPGKQSHFTTPASAEPFYIKWMADRFAEIPALNGCETNSSAPARI